MADWRKSLDGKKGYSKAGIRLDAQRSISLATSIPIQIISKYLRMIYLMLSPTGHFTLVTLFHINRLAVSN